MVFRTVLPSVQPMQPARVPPFHRDGWVYEEKVDGWRMLAFKERGRVRLISRQGEVAVAVLKGRVLDRLARDEAEAGE